MKQKLNVRITENLRGRIREFLAQQQSQANHLGIVYTWSDAVVRLLEAGLNVLMKKR